MANGEMGRATRALEAEYKRSVAHTEKLRLALAALLAVDSRSTGKKVMLKKRLVECSCGTKFHAVRSDATWCSECRADRSRSAARKTIARKKRGTTLVKNTPTGTR